MQIDRAFFVKRFIYETLKGADIVKKKIIIWSLKIMNLRDVLKMFESQEEKTFAEFLIEWE